MEEKRVGNNANRAAEQMTEAIQKSYQAIADNTVTLQEHNMRFFQDLFWAGSEILRGQAQANREMAQTLAEQTQRQQEALRMLAQESTNAYMDFVNSMFTFYQGSVETAQRGTREAGRYSRIPHTSHRYYNPAPFSVVCVSKLLPLLGPSSLSKLD